MDYITVFDEAREEGYEEGRKEGRAEAREKFTKSIILKMLKKAMPLAEIADLRNCHQITYNFGLMT